MITILLAIINTVIYGFIALRIYSDVQKIKQDALTNRKRTDAVYLQFLIWLREVSIDREQYENARRINDIINKIEKET